MDNYFCDGQMSIFDMMSSDKVKIRKPIRLIELFAGYGSQAMALKRTGLQFTHHFVCEFDKFAIKSYNSIHDTEFPVIDIRDVKGGDLRITDCQKYMYFMTYSFPCTDLSVAGKQQGMSKGSGTRSGLLWEVERILKELNDEGKELPQIMMMENVTQVHGKNAIDDFNSWIAFLDSIGYVSVWKDLNAKDYGVPQNRNRTFMFSFLKSEFGENPQYNFPKPVQLNKVLKDVLEDDVDEKYYMNSERANKLIESLVADGKI